MESSAAPPERLDRSVALDALRGLAIYGMFLASAIPWSGLPDWMYHAQFPGPARTFNPEHPGITWVDLVFPFFLFTMGAAIPLAKRSWKPAWNTTSIACGQAILRGLLLASFAIYMQHIRPTVISREPDSAVYLTVLAGFVFGVLAFIRPRSEWKPWVGWVLRAIGWAGGIWLLTTLTFPDGTGFSKNRSDIIILVLANVAAVGTLIWLFTAARPGVRLVVLLGLVAVRLSATVPDTWAHTAWHYNDLGWLVSARYLNYLIIVIPGTMVGDMLVSLARASKEGAQWSNMRLGAIAWLGLATNLFMLIVFFERWMAWIYAIGLALVWLVAMRRATSPWEQKIAQMGSLGLALLIVGSLLEPFEGGIKKDPNTLSYLFSTAGLGTLLLAGFCAWERCRSGVIGLKPMAVVGINPMVAYLAISSLFPPLWHFTIGPWMNSITPGPGLGMLNATVQIVLFGLIIAVFTRFKIMMKT